MLRNHKKKSPCKGGMGGMQLISGKQKSPLKNLLVVRNLDVKFHVKQGYWAGTGALNASTQFDLSTESFDDDDDDDDGDDYDSNTMDLHFEKEVRNLFQDEQLEQYKFELKFKSNNEVDRAGPMSYPIYGHPYREPQQQLIQIQGSLFDKLLKHYSQYLRVKVKIDGLRWPRGNQLNSALPYLYTSSNPSAILQTKEMSFMNKGGDNITTPSSTASYCEAVVAIPPTWVNEFQLASEYRNRINQFCMRVTIEVSYDQNFEFKTKSTGNGFSIVKKILAEKIETDAILAGKCGSEIKCHKSFLSAHSAVLATMFQSGFKESKTCKVQMVDMTKPGIDAFLEYLYYWEIGQAEKHSFIALELFEAAHKYDVASLEERVKHILKLKPNKWYDVNVALRLFLFSRNVSGCEDLKTKSITVLKSMFKELQASEEYQTLFAKDTKAAMELCALAFSI